jgi:hypothetical protein
MTETSWKELFKPDSGIVFEIRAYGVTAGDYDILLPLLTERYPAVYSEDGNPKDLPDHNTIVRRRNLTTPMLALNVIGVRVRCWFWGDNEIDLDLLPDDVDSEEKAEGVFGLMKTIAATLKKRVLLTAENAGATEKWSEEHAICAFDPPQPA